MVVDGCRYAILFGGREVVSNERFATRFDAFNVASNSCGRVAYDADRQSITVAQGQIDVFTGHPGVWRTGWLNTNFYL